MNHREEVKFAGRVEKVPKSFVREILKVTEKPEVISFAGGLPSPKTFPVEGIKRATEKVLNDNGADILQYSTTEGYTPLREFIVNRYYKDCDVTVDNILITNGSQQALDLISKVMIDKDDYVMLEHPGYLGAIQCFSVFEPKFISVELNEDGINLDELKEKINEKNPKLYYAVTNFQNPSGITYSNENREKVAEIVRASDTIMIDDNPYGELRFYGEPCKSMKSLLGDKCIALGSFSKIFAPAMRLGWVCASDEIIEKLIVMKQAADLHTNYFSQRVLYEYLCENDIDEHIKSIRKLYKEKRDYMVEMIEKYMPKEIKSTKPHGGMFLWITVPDSINVSHLLEKAGEKNVAFVPGVPFYTCKEEDPNNTMRLNYTNASLEDIEKGIAALAEAIKEQL